MASLVCAAALISGLSSADAGDLPLISHHGRWLIDPHGRVVILHGVQIDHAHVEANDLITDIDLAPSNVPFIAAEGFNVARVSLTYTGVEPQLGHFDDNYIRQFAAFDRQLAAAGIYDLVTMMQGQYGSQFDGAGFPDWMTYTDGVPNIPGPFPQSYIYDPAEQRAWDNFWANRPASDGVGLQDHYARGLRYLARTLSSQPAFLGFDLLNEPWPGSHWPTCANPAGCPVFDQQLNAFYRRIIPQLRADESRHLVFYEPHALFDQGAATNLGSIGDPGAVFTFHNYCLGNQPGLPQADPGQDCGIEEQMVHANADAQQARTGDGLLEDEWGNTNSVPLLERSAAEADGDMVGWSYWAYEQAAGGVPGSVVKDGTKPPTPDNLNTPLLDALVRPYPRAIAGTPTSFGYDPASATFHLNYQAKLTDGRPATGMQTEIFVPRRHYPTGYKVQVSGASVTSTPTAGILRVCNLSGSGPVSVTVTPETGSSTDLPDTTQSPTTCPAGGESTSVSGGHYIVSAGGSRVVVPGVASIALPPARGCLRGRRFSVRVHLRRGVRLLRASVTLNGRRVPVKVTRPTTLTAIVDLGRRPRGAHRVRIVLRVRRGGRTTTIRINRTFHTCAPKRRA